MNYDDPPPYEDEPLARPLGVPEERYRTVSLIHRILNHPTCSIAVFCAGSILLSVFVTLIVVFGRCQNSVISTTTTTITTTTTSTTTTTFTTTTRPVCFDGNSIVSKADGNLVRMSQLNVGDQVLVAHHDVNGDIELRSSPVLAIDIYQQYDQLSPLPYLEIHTTTNGTTLHITASHSILVRKNHQSSPDYLFASQINVGDHLYFVREDDRSIDEVTVTQIDNIIQFDAYAPLTLEGNLIVNRCIVSCYGTFTHSTGHIVKMIRRWWLYWHLNHVFTSI